MIPSDMARGGCGRVWMRKRATVLRSFDSGPRIFSMCISPYGITIRGTDWGMVIRMLSFHGI